MAKGIGPTKGSNAVKKALRYCRDHPCQCLADRINMLVNGHDTGQGWNKGIIERISHMLSPTADPPGTLFNGKDTFQEHATQIRQRKQSLNDLLEEYDAQGCGGGGGSWVVDLEAARAARDARVPTPDDYWDRYPERKPTSSSNSLSTAERIGYGILGTGLLAAAAALAFFPFDGPAGEYAAGMAGITAWGLAIGGSQQNDQ